MVLNEAKVNGDTIQPSEYNQVAATVNDITTNGLPQNLTFSGTTFTGIIVNSLTTTQRDLITPSNGTIIYNTTTGTFQVRQAGAWKTIMKVNEDSSPQLAADLDANNKDLQNIALAEFYSVYDNGNSGTLKNLDWNNGNLQSITLTGSCTFTFTAPSGPARVSLRIAQDGTGSRTVTWPTMKWSGAAAPTLTTTANRSDWITIIYDGTIYWGTSSLNFN